MTDQESGPSEADMDELAADLAMDAKESYEVQKQEQEAFLDTVAEEEGAEVLETQCNLIGEYTVPLKAKMNGEILDRLGALDARVERLEDEPDDARAYEFSETADDVAQLLDDVIDDPEYHKDLFYEVYQSEGLEALGALLENCFVSLKKERERRSGAADGFRQNS